MRLLRYLLAAALSLAPLPIVDAQSAGWLPLARAGSGGTAPTFDGSGCASGFNTPNCAITTTQTNDLIVAVVAISNGTETVSGASLSWTKVGTGNPSLWWAISSGTLSAQTITSTAGQNLTVFAVNGAHNAAPFNGSIGFTSSTTSSITTSAANDLVFSIKGDYCDPVDAGFTQFGLVTYQTGEYKTAASATTYNWAWSGCSGSTANIVTGAVLAGP